MAEAAAKEPSMEDILSSIRKIIAEEGGAQQQDQSQGQAAQLSEQTQSSPSTNNEQTPRPITSISEAASQIAAADANNEEFPNETHVSSVLPKDNADPVITKNEPTPLEEPNPAGSIAGIAEVVKTKAAEDRAAGEIYSPIPVHSSPSQSESIPQMPDPSIAATASSQQSDVTRVEMAEAKPAAQAQREVPVLASALGNENAQGNAVEATDEATAFKGALMSPSADGAVSSAFQRLKRSAHDDLDAKTEAILRPMLREWLDENLPTLVEKLVREEIERVARG